jgi:hypothetical protein
LILKSTEGRILAAELVKQMVILRVTSAAASARITDDLCSESRIPIVAPSLRDGNVDNFTVTFLLAWKSLSMEYYPL